MNTTTDKLELLLRTKERQKAYLQEKYPLLDFDIIPFRAYLDLFQGRSYVPGFVGGWKSYGRSNSEDSSTRDILPDYSGNGRDIRLYNFGFAGMSGWNGYGSTWIAYGDTAEQVNSNTVKIGFTRFEGVILQPLSKGESLTVRYRITGLPSGSTLNLYTNTRNSEGSVVFSSIREIEKDGTYTDTITWDSENAADDTTKSQVFLLGRNATYPEDMAVLAEQLPLYPGALVSDGVDDCGQCIKGFALPDDYTVVAVRKIFNTASDSALVSKSRTSWQGAFIFDINQGGYSYGNISSGSYNAPLFSYQTKTSYNGVDISPGSGTDTEDDTLCLFKKGVNRGDYLSAALYDLRIYDHSLTAEELQAVKDEMMADYEAATGGGITDVTYVADWDAKGRSNDEEETMRSKWIDKVNGRVINLNNYSFSKRSGWNGYQFDWSSWHSDIAANGGSVTRTKTSVRMTNTGNSPNYSLLYLTTTPNVEAFKIRVTGLKDKTTLFFYGSGASFSTKKDGVYTINYATPLSSEVNYFRLEGYSANEEADLLIEQLPLYPGALVSDGVDDYGQSAEAISEEVGTMLVYGDYLTTNLQYLLSCGLGTEDTWLYATLEDNNGVARLGLPNKTVTDTMPMGSLTRDPASPNNNMILFTAGDRIYACAWLARLILIREQLDDAAVEFLKWKVDKEYRDWLKEKGYDYAIDEMLNN